MTREALTHDVHGRVVLEAVLCRTGKVADVRIIEGLPYGMTEAALLAVKSVKFTPAEMNSHSVSQLQRFEFHFNERGEPIAREAAVGRLVEAIEVVGNRRFSDAEIMEHIKTKLGEPFNGPQILSDLESILATGSFNSLTSRVLTNAGLRGGVRVVFELQELPLISEVKFQGLHDIAASGIVADLHKQQIELREGAAYDADKAKIATELIRRMLESNGQAGVKVELLVENLSATSVSLTFVINPEGRRL
jgi:TonB family protein